MLPADIAMSPLQKKCIDGLTSLAAELNAAIERVEAAGSTERYLVADLLSNGGHKFSAWIYVDECMLSCGGKSFYFEKPDFSDEDELKTVFLSAVTSLMQGKEPDQKGSSRVTLFVGRDL